MFEQPQYGMLANQPLKTWLAKYGYYKVTYMTGIWKHHLGPIQFMLVVDDFGIKFVNNEDAKHLLISLKDYYEVEIDWNHT